MKPQEHQSEYGVALRGPHQKKQDLLFMGTYDGFYYHKDNNPAYTTIPTMLMRQGNFSELLNLSTPQPIYDPTSCPIGTTGAHACVRRSSTTTA